MANPSGELLEGVAPCLHPQEQRRGRSGVRSLRISGDREMIGYTCMKVVAACALVACIGAASSACWWHGHDARGGGGDHHDDHGDHHDDHGEHHDDRR